MKVGTTRQTINELEKRANVEDSRYLGKVLEVLGLDPYGRPKDTAAMVDADLRRMRVPELIALQGRITAEFAHRLTGAGASTLPDLDSPDGMALGYGDMPDVDLGTDDQAADESRREG